MLLVVGRIDVFVVVGLEAGEKAPVETTRNEAVRMDEIGAMIVDFFAMKSDVAW